MIINIQKEGLKKTKVYDTYWKFACERQNIFMRKLMGEKDNLTEDIILREMYAKYISLKYKTKVYREINERFFKLSVEGSEMWKRITDRESFSIWIRKDQPR